MAERIDLSERDASHIHRAVFFDRDGVIDQKPPEGDYVKRVDQLIMLEKFYDLLKIVDPNEYIIIVVTNQRGIARGLYTRDDLKDISHEMNNNLKINTQLQVDYIYYCSHDHGDPDCNCRKPLPGMFTDAINEHVLIPDLCIMIGDTAYDSDAAHQAGLINIIQIETDHPEQAIEPLKLFIYG